MKRKKPLKPVTNRQLKARLDRAIAGYKQALRRTETINTDVMSRLFQLETRINTFPEQFGEIFQVLERVKREESERVRMLINLTDQIKRLIHEKNGTVSLETWVSQQAAKRLPENDRTR